MAPAGAKSTWEKYGIFLNSFHSDVKWLIQRFEWINDKIGRNEVSVLFDQTHLKEKMLYIYIFIETWKRTWLLKKIWKIPRGVTGGKSKFLGKIVTNVFFSGKEKNQMHLSWIHRKTSLVQTEWRHSSCSTYQ